MQNITFDDLFAYRFQCQDITNDEIFIIRKLKYYLYDNDFLFEDIDEYVFQFYIAFGHPITLDEIKLVEIHKRQDSDENEDPNSDDNEELDNVSDIETNNFNNMTHILYSYSFLNNILSSGNIPIAQTEDIPNIIIPVMHIGQTEDIPVIQTQQNEDIPSQGSTSIPITHSEDIPSQGSTSIPITHSEDIPSQGSTSIPITHSEDIPSQGSTSIPITHSEDIPSQGPSIPINTNMTFNIPISFPSNSIIETFINILNAHQTQNNIAQDIVVTTDDINNINKIELDETQQDKCSICMSKLEKGDTILDIECKHKFHTECLTEYLEKYNHICPICRQDIGKSKINY